MNWSYWEYKTFFSDVQTVVVGSGIVGLSTAIYLKQSFPDKRVLVLERDMFSAGASSKNAGFACFGSISELLDDLDVLPEHEVFALVERRYKGLLNLRALLGDAALCYEPVGGFEVFTESDSNLRQRCEDALPYMNDQLQRITGDASTYKKLEPAAHWGFKGVAACIQNVHEGAIDTGAMLKRLHDMALQLGIEVLHGIEVIGIDILSADAASVRTAFGDIRCRQVAVCTNGFARTLLPQLDVRPARNQVVVTSPVEGLNWKGTFHMNRGYVYFREVHGRVLLGGFRDTALEAESTSAFGLTEHIQSQLESFLKEVVLPHQAFTIEHRWSGILGLGPNRNTIVQRVDGPVFAGVRMGGMGVAIGSLVGKELAALMAQG